MALHFKPILVAGCITGSTCATGVPLTMHYLKNSDSTNSKNYSLQLTNLTNEQKGNQSEINRTLSFDQLWNQIEESYKASQEKLNKTKLPWRTEFRGLIDPFAETHTEWTIQEKDWKNCQESLTKEKSFCGYLKFKEKNTEYKLKISYNNTSGVERKGQWHLILVKSDGKSVSSFVKRNSDWAVTTQVNYNDLTSFRISQNKEWEKIEEESIVKDNELEVVTSSIRRRPKDRKK